MTTAIADRLREAMNSEDMLGLPPLSTELVGLLDLPSDLPERLSIGQVAEFTGVRAHTLRYWERIGLLRVRRDTTGYRIYDRDALAQVAFVARLRLSDMPIQTIRRYVDLVNAGRQTVPQRLALMRAHREFIARRLRQLQTALAVIDFKIDVYSDPEN